MKIAATETALPPWPAVSIAQAHALLTAPGSPLEMETLDLGAGPVRVWKNGPKSLVDVYQAALSFRDRPFVVHEAERVTYDAFVRAAMVFAHTLIGAGVKKGDRVAVIMRNIPEWPVAFFGAALAGAIATPLNAWWSGAELLYGLKDSGAVAAVFDAERLARVGDRLSEAPALRHLFVARLARDADIPSAGSAQVRTLEAILGGSGDWAGLPPAGDPPVEVSPEDDATLFYTSGTTGGPKGALASHRAVTTPILATMLSAARAFVRRGEAPPLPDPQAPQRRGLVSIPFFHVTGCFSLLNINIIQGAMLVLMRRFDPEGALALIERERINAIGGVPTIAWQLLEHPSAGRYDLSSLDQVSYGGAPAAPELVRRMHKDWPQAQTGTGWGMTETCATFTHHTGEDYAHRPDSAGPATPVGDMKVVDEAGETLTVGQVGELCVRGPHVVRGYWNKPEATASTFVDGWLRTGDLARLDEEGFLFIVDRAKDVIIRGGENIYPAEVEAVLYTHPAVMDAAVTAIPHRILGEQPGAVVTLKPGAIVGEEELRALVASQLASFKVPVTVLIRTEPLPRNANGKILKAALRELFAPAGVASPAPIADAFQTDLNAASAS